MPSNNPQQIIHEAKRLVEWRKAIWDQAQCKRWKLHPDCINPMQRKKEYITQLQTLLSPDGYTIIDLNKCLIDFVSRHRSEVEGLFELLQSATHEIFKAPATEESLDLFKDLIEQNKISLARIRYSAPRYRGIVRYRYRQYSHYGERNDHEGCVAFDHSLPGNQRWWQIILGKRPS